MMMKKLLYTLLAITFALVSCSEQIDVQETVPADCIMLKVFNSPMTKAVTDRSGEEYEKTLKRLDCFFYVKGQTDRPCVYYQKVDVDKVTTAEIPLYVDESVINTIFPGGNTTCDVFVIANLPSGTFTAGAAGTDVATLNKTSLQLGQGYDAIDQNFLMAGLNVATKGNDNNATGTIPLYRAAAKITVSVNIPDEIIVEYEKADDVTMKPVLADDQDKVTLKTAFHNGVSKTYLRDDYSDQIVADDFFYTEKKSYKYVSTIAETADAPKKYVYTCEIPFYSYARTWEKGADNAPYLTLEIPWKNETTGEHQTYYYQILVNAAGRELRPNAWYDLTVNVGVLGSTVESEPVAIKDLTYYILDWTIVPEHEDDRYEDVDIQKHTYLVVPETRIEINNATSGVLRFDASHKLGIKMNTASKEVEILPGTNTNEDAFYINCRSNPPSVAQLGINTDNFTIDDSNGILTYNYTIQSDVYSPVYVYATIWLELDGTAGMSNAESEFSENITIVQYPPIYIIPELSVSQSVYVNGENKTRTSHNVIYVNGETYDLGGAPGSDNSKYMHTINVSSFTTNNTFELHGQDISYIIGDPRVRVSDINLNNDGYDMKATNSWALDGANRRLEHYYPTGTEGEVYRVISPKFRVSSKLGGYSEGDREGVMMRCASYQENGYPAGRWRVPTTAEIAFIVYLQSQEAIQDLFVNNYYFSSTHMVTEGNNKEVIEDIDNADHSVRCVYDEWYWGSEQEAIVNTGTAATDGDHYLFTWGDKQIW